MSFKVVSQTINNHVVTITIDVQDDIEYGYGYGNADIDFFDVFGIPGNESGYFVSSEMDEVTGLSDYNYGFGYEYSQIINNVNVGKTITITLETETPTADTFSLNISIIGEGYADTYRLDSIETSSPQTISVYKRDSESPSQFIAFSDDSATWRGTKYPAARDSFFDIIVAAENTLDAPSLISVKGNVEAISESISKTIKVHGTVNGS